MKETPIPLSADSARRLFLAAQGLGDQGELQLLELIQQLGFVQVDTIQTVARAQDLILLARKEEYRPEALKELLEAHRLLFEHWTHDASIIPLAWYAHWKPRFRRDRPRIEAHPWWQKLLGEHYREVCDEVLERISRNGPLRSVDFEHVEKRGPWWGWKPAKAALDYLWRTGELAIRGRQAFQKVYDLPEKVYPQAQTLPEPDPEAHREWACSTAAERLQVFTPLELRSFWEAMETEDAWAWCRQAAREGRIQPVLIKSADGSKPQQAFVCVDWEARLKRTDIPEEIRLLAPFDPLLRDRARCLRRFGFDFRFEGFVPEAKRQYGYYVMPILEGDRLIGRLDPKFHRESKILEIKGLWWESGIRPTKIRRKALQSALEKLGTFLGATNIAPDPVGIPLGLL